MSESRLLTLTGSQTIGPFFKYGLEWEKGEQAFPPGAPGEKIEITGRLIDGAGAPIVDSMIEFWQADSAGKFTGPVPGSSAGFARAYTDTDGRYRFTTRKPGTVAADDKECAPFVLVCLFSRGMLRHLYTRIYFEGEAANANDAVLKAAGERAATLVARQAGPGRYEWDIVLQGGRETVFLDF
jgi:protocatechuate 3,4-dioxygenase alpha subunit